MRLSGLNSFHLDEGPHFAWLNIYRVLADNHLIDLPRERPVQSFENVNNEIIVRWASINDNGLEIEVKYKIVEEGSVEATFSATARKDIKKLEFFVSSYFTPYYTPSFATIDNTRIYNDLTWYKTKWYGENQDELWIRDKEALEIFKDGRWLEGKNPINWRIGGEYSKPIMIQEHRYGHAIAMMTRPENCIGISGFNSYHNSQYFHLFGKEISTGETLSTTVKMVLLTKWENLQNEVLKKYNEWVTM